MAKKKKEEDITKESPKAETVRPPCGDERERVMWGLTTEKWREICAFFLLSLALLFLLALISSGLEQAWIGSLGIKTAAAAGFVFGFGWVSYVLPVLLILAAFHAFKGHTPFHPIRKMFSGVLLLLAFCALESLPYSIQALDPTANRIAAQAAKDLAFNAGGLLGAFLTSNVAYSPNLPVRCGPVGSYIVSILMLVLGIMLSTDFLLLPLLKRGVTHIRERWNAWRHPAPAPVATLTFGRDHMSRVFPTLESEEEEGDKSRKNRKAEGELPLFSTNLDPGSSAEVQPDDAGQEMQNMSGFLPRITSSNERKGKKAETGLQELQSVGGMIQTELDFSSSEYEAPSLDLFSLPPAINTTMDRDEILEISAKLERALGDFNISAKIVAVTQGPVVTQYELQPAPGVKVSRILNLENDIALILRAKSVRIQAPIPGKAAVGVEVPNRKVTPVYFKELVDSKKFRDLKSPLAFALGKNISGETVFCDLATMPHLLIAGTTGSGKSVCVNVIISSILCRMPPDRVKFIMIDPKRVELNVYSDIPHLLAPVVNEPRQAAAALLWCVQQMEERLEAFSKLRVRNVDGYNAIASGKRNPPSDTIVTDLKVMPHIVIIIDELADLMITAKNEVEEFIVRLAQMSRAAGIHMIIATQRPSVNVLTGIIKANFPSRIAFRVSAKVDSRTILDTNGAETLLGKGDMLYGPGGAKPMRIQGAFLADEDVEKLTDFLRKQVPASYEKSSFASNDPDQQDGDSPFGDGENQDSQTKVPLNIPTESTPPDRRPANQIQFPALQIKGDVDDDEVLYDKALRLVLETKKPSVSMIQRRLKVGFARAGRLMDLMEERGVVGPYLGSKPRDLIVDDPEGLLRRLDELDRDTNL